MSVTSNFTATCHGGNAANFSERKLRIGSEFRIRWSAYQSRTSSSFENGAPHISGLALAPLSRRNKHRSCVRVALVDETIAHRDMLKSSEILAFDLVQGALELKMKSQPDVIKGEFLLAIYAFIYVAKENKSPIVLNVKWSSVMEKPVSDPPTAVFLHGILGSRKNWGTFSRRLAQEFPAWQFLLVDLRCHGDSASIMKKGPHTVASTALDVLKLVQQLKITPRVLVGHSFGGKVVLSMVEQAAKPLARPVRVWVLDATPGKVRPGGDGEDHPAELILFLSTLPNEVFSKRNVVESLIQQGFSKDVAQWVVTNLRPSMPRDSKSSRFSWVFDLKGIAEMYQSYEETNLWKVVEDVPRGVHINFLKAERSLHRWALEDLRRIHAAEELAAEEGGGVEMHVLEDAGHWVHTDNPDGLFRILSSTFQGFKT